jgi:hypothetical protein
MNNKRLLVIITEGPTDKEFYKEVLNTIKLVNGNAHFNFDDIKHLCAKGIGRLENKMLSKFKNNYCTKEYDNYERVVCLCYDLDVFKYSQKPPVNRKELEKALLKVGAHKVIKIEANNTIEDFFLYDYEGIKRYLKLSKNYKIPNLSGLPLLEKMFKDGHKIYTKGEKVEGLINQLNLEKILSHICNQLKPLCDELGYGCDGKKCNSNKKVQ